MSQTTTITKPTLLKRKTSALTINSSAFTCKQENNTLTKVKEALTNVPNASTIATQQHREFETSNVVWHETKVSNNRWLLNVKGTMKANDDHQSLNPVGHFVLVGDQIATKIGKQDYEVDMIASKFQYDPSNINSKHHIIGYLSHQLERQENLFTKKRHIGSKVVRSNQASVQQVLEKENQYMLDMAQGLIHNNLTADPAPKVSTLKYFTEKGKTMQTYARTKKKQSITFGPAVGTQYHWFYVSDMVVKPSTSGKENEFDFTIESNKFQYSFGRPTTISTKAELTNSITNSENVVLGQDMYNCLRIPVKKSTFLKMVMNDRTIHQANQKRLTSAQQHFNDTKAKKLHYNSPKEFIDIDGSKKRYTGMPVGGSHQWYYRDAIMEESSIPSPVP